MTFSRLDEALLIMATLPFALTGGIWLLYLMDYPLSVATAVGFIALAGVAAEFGVIMVLRIRPKMMTVTVIVTGLLPLFFGSGTGSEIMSRIAAPMIGGMLTAPLAMFSPHSMTD